MVKVSIGAIVLALVSFDVTAAAYAQTQAGTYPIQLRLDVEVPARIRVIDLDQNGQEIVPLTALISRPGTMPLPMTLQCRRNVDNRRILVEAYTEGRRFAEAVTGNFCSQDDDGARSIVVYLARPSQRYPDADRFNAYQEVVNAH